MSRCTFNTLSLISALLLVCTVVLWAWSFWTDPHWDYLSFNDNSHVGFFDGRIDFFSDRDGPYHPGSAISLSGHAEISERRAFGDRYGIFYRYLRLTDSTVLFTLNVSLLYAMIVFAGLPVAWAWRRWRTKTAVG